MEEKIKATHNRVDGAGWGVKFQDRAQIFSWAISKCFEYYFDLEPFCGKIASAYPTIDTYGIEYNERLNNAKDEASRDWHVSEFPILTLLKKMKNVVS